MKHYLRFMITLLLATVWSLGGYGQETPEVTLDFTSNNWGLKTSGNKATDAGTYTNGTYSIVVGGNLTQTGFYYSSSNKSVILGKSGATLSLPKFDFDVEKIVLVKCVSGTPSGKVTQNIFVDNVAVSSETTGANADNTYLIKDGYTAAGNIYTLKVTNGYNTQFSKIEIYKKAGTKTSTTLSFNSDFDATKTYTFTAGTATNGYVQPIATLDHTFAESDGAIKYTSSNTDVVDVDETTGKLSFAGKTVYDTEATITAQFIASESSTFASSNELTYKVMNVEAQVAKPKLFFSESSATVVYGKETEFIAPTLTLIDAEGNEVKDQSIIYGAETEGVVDVDIETGKITKWIKPGTTKVTAIVDGGDYNNLSAEYTLVYDKATTTIEFAEGEHSVDINKSISVKAILKAHDAGVSDATVSYSSSNDKIATVDENGNITGVAGGKTTITAAFAGNDYYKEATSVNYDVEVTDPNVITVFYESFDKFNSVGGNDGKFDQSSTAVLTNLNDADNSGWTFENSVFEANKCLRIAASKKNGAIKTPQINFSGDATLTFKVGAWSKKKTSGAVIVTITNGKLSYNGKEAPTQTIDIPDAKFGDLSMNIVGATYGMTIKFESATNKDNQFFLDEVKITAPKPGELTLGEGNNDKVLDEAIKETDKLFNVTLNRTMQADGGWYTFSVPFDIADVSTTPLKDAEIRQYKSMTGSIMNFEATTSLKAAHAYLVKPTTDIANPVFQNVTVSLGDNVVDGADGYEFVGIYSDRRLETDGTNLFLGADNKFYVPTSDDCTLKALRGYFVAPSADSGAKMSIDIDGNTTSISALNSGKAIMNGRVYNLNGQYVGKDVKALQKGIYMVNGKKYIVK